MLKNRSKKRLDPGLCHINFGKKKRKCQQKTACLKIHKSALKYDENVLRIKIETRAAKPEKMELNKRNCVSCLNKDDFNFV